MNVISRATALALGWTLAAALAPAGAIAQQQAAAPAASSARAPAVKKAQVAKKTPARAASSAAPDWNAQLASCKNDAGMNLVKREKCVYAHCKGHWGQGECPPGQDMPTKESFKNPFRRGS
jgi:hypothetical protein